MPKGSKTCPECSAVCRSVAASCYCGYEFVAKQQKEPKAKVEKPVKEVKFYDEPGQGRKQCSGCHRYIGAILKKCPCGSTEFVKRIVELHAAKPIHTYDEPGKGRKECVSCHKHVGFPVKKCLCGSIEFVKKTAVVEESKEIIVHKKPGKGLKYCKGCEGYVGIRTATCSCGNVFFEQQVNEECELVAKSIRVDRFDVPTKTDVEASKHQSRCGCGKRIIIAPAGDAPKLHSIDAKAVCTWAEKTIQLGHDMAIHYSPAALRYFLARQYDPDMSNHTAEELSTIIDHLNNCVTGEDAESDPYEDQGDVTDDDELSAEAAEDLAEDLAAV